MDRLNLILIFWKILVQLAIESVGEWSEISKIQTPLLMLLLVIFV